MKHHFSGVLPAISNQCPQKNIAVFSTLGFGTSTTHTPLLVFVVRQAPREGYIEVAGSNPAPATKSICVSPGAWASGTNFSRDVRFSSRTASLTCV